MYGQAQVMLKSRLRDVELARWRGQPEISLTCT